MDGLCATRLRLTPNHDGRWSGGRPGGGSCLVVSGKGLMGLGFDRQSARGRAGAEASFGKLFARGGGAAPAGAASDDAVRADDSHRALRRRSVPSGRSMRTPSRCSRQAVRSCCSWLLTPCRASAAPGRSLGTTLPVFQDRVPRILNRLGLPEAWAEAKARGLADIHVMHAGGRDGRPPGARNHE